MGGLERNQMIGMLDAAADVVRKDEKRQLLDLLFYRIVMSAKYGSEMVRRIRADGG
jgi:hypothetical protein